MPEEGDEDKFTNCIDNLKKIDKKCLWISDEVRDPWNDKQFHNFEVMVQLVESEFNRQSIGSYGQYTVYTSDVTYLWNNKWISDAAIGGFLSMALAHYHTSHKKFCLIDTVMGVYLKREQYNQIAQWLQKRGNSFISVDIFVIPIHIPGHWLIGFIETAEKTVTVLDPLGAVNCLNALEWQLRLWNLVKAMSVSVKKNEWSFMSSKNFDNLPLQKNGVDCGVFVIMVRNLCRYVPSLCSSLQYGLLRICSKRLSFSQSDMPNIRKWIASTIANVTSVSHVVGIQNKECELKSSLTFGTAGKKDLRALISKCRKQLEEIPLETVQAKITFRLPYFEEIASGRVHNIQHELFMISPTKKLVIATPFTEDQLLTIAFCLTDHFKGSASWEYAMSVLLPEAKIVMLMDLMKIERHDAIAIENKHNVHK
eukprot:m.283539 g.283539  ORF g.283539 m.283539 type:complete len:424 (+) comp40671_c0_seq19:616-1887(+)